MIFAEMNRSTGGSVGSVNLVRSPSSNFKLGRIGQQSSSSSLQQPIERHCILRLVLSLLTSLGKIPLLGHHFKWLTQKLDPQATAHHSQATAHHSQATAHHSQATAHHSQATAHHSQATAHHSQERPHLASYSPFIQNYAAAFEINLLKLVQEKKADGPEVQKAQIALVEAFAAYRSAKENIVKLAIEWRDKRSKDPKCRDQVFNHFSLQLFEEIEKRQPQEHFVDRKNQLKQQIQQQTLLSNAIKRIEMEARYVRASQPPSQEESESPNDFISWQQSVGSFGLRNKVVDAEATANYLAQIEHQMSLKEEDANLSLMSIRSSHHIEVSNMEKEALNYEFMARHRHLTTPVSKEADAHNQDLLDQLKAFSLLQNLYEEELLKFAALLVADQTAPLESLTRLLSSEEENTKERLSCSGLLAEVREANHAISSDLNKMLDQGKEVLKEISTARLTAKNQTLLIHEFETLVNELSYMLSRALPSWCSLPSLPNVGLIKNETEAFARAYLRYLVTTDGKLRRAKDVTQQDEKIVGKAFGRMVIPALLSSYYRSGTFPSECAELGEILGEVLGYFNFFDLREQIKYQAEIDSHCQTSLETRNPYLYGHCTQRKGLSTIVANLSTQLVSIKDNLDEIHKKIFRQDPH